jgi:folate-binding protein YgfZ
MSQALPEIRLPSGVASLPHLGVIEANGPEAAPFLHGQLTQDFALLGQDEARLAALCTAKGRMLASFIGFKQGDEQVLLVTHREGLPAMLKRLSMFVLRAKVRLVDASAGYAMAGLIGDAAEAVASRPLWSRLAQGPATLVALPPAAGQPRALWIAPAGTPLPPGASIAADIWRAADVLSGVATLEPAVAEAFVPQMLNYESVGGVNFKKGCYPGQEVVARSQFRGTLKRRGFIVEAAAPMAAGQEIYLSDQAEQPVGLVAQVAPNPQAPDHHLALASLTLDAAPGALRLGAADGPALHLRPLPYSLLEDI